MLVPVLVLATALLLAMVLTLALKPVWSARLTTVVMILALLGGLVFYGCGYAENTHNLLLSIIRTPFSVIRMFVGVNEWAQVSGSTLGQQPWGETLFWIVHLLAFYSMASAAMMTLGAEALRQLRLLLSRRGDLTLIYGIHDNSIALARACREAGHTSVVFVADSAPAATVTELNNMGMSVLTGEAVTQSRPEALRWLGLGSRPLTVYALDPEVDRNLFYALRLRDTLQALEVPPEQTRLTLPGDEDILADMLQLSTGHYGFGYVNVFDPSDLVARALIRLCPPWELMTFDRNGRAQEDFHVAVVGFGRNGQAVLKQMVMNGQFAGSRFQAAVFSPSFEQECGYLLSDCPQLLREYAVESFTADGRSRVFYDYIGKHLSTLKLIAVCTGSEDMNREIADNLMLYLHRRNAEHICVVQCGHQGVRCQRSVGSPIQSVGIYTLDLLSAELADRGGILLNAVYDRSQRSDWEKWTACSSFNKMSSRASAEYLPAFLRMAGISREEAMGGGWHPKGALLETLAETEHLRWCAFHYAMGYVPMSRHQFESNAQEWADCQAAGKPCDIRIAKDTLRRTHACLIPWEALPELSRRETELTGRAVDYQQYDRDNVLAVPLLLGAKEEEA